MVFIMMQSLMNALTSNHDESRTIAEVIENDWAEEGTHPAIF